MHYHLFVCFLFCLLPIFVSCKREDSPPIVQPVYDLPKAPILSAKGIKLILDYEVGGGESYYNKKLKFPTVPPADSGITIGIGWDCGYNTKEAILRDWRKLPKPHPEKLSGAAGLKKEKARAYLPQVKDIPVPWSIAYEVFNEVTLSQFYQVTKNAYPGLERLHPDAQAALVSLVFNRGSSKIGATRVEMRNIEPLVLKKDYEGIAREIRSMKRLWPDLPGLQKRREAEADLVQSCKL